MTVAIFTSCMWRNPFSRSLQESPATSKKDIVTVGSSSSNRCTSFRRFEKRSRAAFSYIEVMVKVLPLPAYRTHKDHELKLLGTFHLQGSLTCLPVHHASRKTSLQGYVHQRLGRRGIHSSIVCVLIEYAIKLELVMIHELTKHI